nr:hypothetical protein [uncultured Flavobacterium sp.]
MFSIFKRTTDSQELTPELVSVTQVVEINEDLIIIYENDSFKGSVNINLIDQIVFEHHGLYDDKKPNCWLSLKSKGQEMLSVSTLATNYASLDAILVNLTGFNATNYRELINYEKPINDVTIFKREIKEADEPVVGSGIIFVDETFFEKAEESEITQPTVTETEITDIPDVDLKNAETTTHLESNFGGFDFDFDFSNETPIEAPKADVNIDNYIIIEDRDAVITWKSYKSIDRKYFNRELFTEDGKVGYKYKVEFITIFDDVKLPYLETKSVVAKTEENISEKFPIEEYYCEIHSNYILDEFNKLTEKINTYFNKKGETYSTESRLPVYTLKVSTVTIDIKTTPTSIILRIIKDMDESSFYDKAYGKELSLDYVEVIRIPQKINILANYKNSSKVMFTPKCFAPVFETENDTIFWIHKDGSKFGMANAKYGISFKPIKIIKIRLAVEQDKGIESKNRIEVIYKDGKKFNKVSVDNSIEFAKYLPQIMVFLKLPFTLYKYDKIK